MSLFYRFLWVLAVFCSSLAALAEPVAWGGQWLTQSSEHFVVNYHAEHSAQAQRALAIAEQVHQELLPFFNQAPQQKTQLVIVDDFDLSNGWATPLPFNQIRLFLHVPNNVAGLEHMDDWWHGLIRHEYVHILHMDMGRAAVAAGRQWFGRLPFLFPHVFTPAMLSEGLAVYLETNPELDYGRLASSSYAMQMRAEVHAHGADELNQVVAAQRDWPLGKAYLYGAYFWQYIAQEYGEHSISNYLQAYSGQLLPYIMQNHTARQVFGKSFQQLWDEYRQWLQDNYSSTDVMDSVSGKGLLRKLNNQQVTASSATGLWQVRTNGEDRPAIQLWSAEQEKPQRQTYTKQVVDLDVNAHDELIMSRLIPHKTGQVYGDLFLWSKSQGWQRLTSKQRFTQVRWLDNDQILASRQQAGVSELWLLNKQGQQSLLWRSEEAVLGSFSVYPEQMALVASVKRAQQGWNLERFNLTTLAWQPLTSTRATEHQPEFLADGSVLYSADYDGVFNIYRMLPDSQIIEQLTALTTGAFQPRFANNQLYYQHYTASGYQLQQADLVVLREISLDDYQGQYDYPVVGQPVLTHPSKPYSPWATIRPTYWLPLFWSDEDTTFAGLATGGSDALGRHAYELELSYNPEFRLTQGTASYFYDNRWQWLYLRDHRFYELGSKTTQKLVVARDKWLLARHHIWNAYEDQLQLHAGFSYENYSLAYQPSSYSAQLNSARELLSGLALTFNNQQSFLHVPNIGYGTQARLVYENYRPFSQRINGYRIQGGWQHVFDLPGRSSIIAELLAGYSNQTVAPYVLGGSGSKDETRLFGRSEFSFAGYQSGALQGNHLYQGKLSYRQWLARVERNWGMWPLGLGDISAQLWSQTGNAWYTEHQQPFTSLGVQLDIELILGYQMVAPLSFAVAHGLDKEQGRTQAYVQLGFVF